MNIDSSEQMMLSMRRLGRWVRFERIVRAWCIQRHSCLEVSCTCMDLFVEPDWYSEDEDLTLVLKNLPRPLTKLTLVYSRD